MITQKYIFYSLGVFVIIFMFVMWTDIDYGNFKTPLRALMDFKQLNSNAIVIMEDIKLNNSLNNSSLKYVLIWTLPQRDPLMYLGEGQVVFIKKKCPVTNCYITTNKQLMNLKNFDVLLFNVPEINDKPHPNLPPERSPHQIYVFASIESADYYPLCSTRFDNYFNLTWTYKLNSDLYYGYMIIRNKQGEVIGPNQIMHWEKIENMDPIDDKIKERLKNKNKAAAWIVSNCNAPSGRDQFVREVQRQLDQYGLVVDIYGNCGKKRCERNMMPKCLEMIEREYYFYFSFENSFAEDYVTEKLLSALNHYAVPVVFGTANYTRFMPDGIYLNAKELGAKDLAKQMSEIINDKERYYNFFKWHNHYSYHEVEEVPETDFHCKLCEKLNSKEVTEGVNVYEHLRDWWNTNRIRPGGCPFKMPVFQ
ncbi:alpha-(1,3)-fucosyltransferase C [Manduca sexta]|uniref:alpha-(1,3)-fucosyltransferase C n=1 Tax=Manduca sexta TaxID=7130 RepID=UPI0018902A49|nr:alpha-(1,3)-fucosyltransferase C [Manduca sexta]